ncbi:hypothetical protein HaLaN_13437 [Haematococcus lacustris]|uniref:Uncharacterized protein n=1 Tax=Haematococcus lacustris TaxID=44745 RepID=A0A699Z2W0_HAELA|nr:hypothetical protein HaLaN_13437 [Haematococcus lacustris]
MMVHSGTPALHGPLRPCAGRHEGLAAHQFNQPFFTEIVELGSVPPEASARTCSQASTSR